MGHGLKHRDWGGKSAASLLLAPSARPLMRVPEADLLATVHEDLVPRLALAHTFDGPLAADRRTPPTSEEVVELAQIAVEGDMRRALQFVMFIEGQGVSVGSILLQLVAPAARLVRDLWQSERATFTEVTAALGVIHGLVDELRACAVLTAADPDERA